MTMAATWGPGAPMRCDVVACIRHLRAFAMMLAGDRRRADDLVRDTIELTFTAENRPRAGIELKVQMFAVLHRLHYAALRPSTEGPAQQRESPLSKEDDLGSDELLRTFGRLRDEQREALILTIASSLSHQQVAKICGCGIAVIENRVSEAWSEISRALLEASPGRKTNSRSRIFSMGSERDAGGFYELASNPGDLETAK
jgi:RNA polymerase sigma-70 factor (ECF subfamily)